MSKTQRLELTWIGKEKLQEIEGLELKALDPPTRKDVTHNKGGET